MLSLPLPRGPISEFLLLRLCRPPGAFELPVVVGSGDDALRDEDLQLALTLCYELHYRGLPGVDERWEWAPSLLAARGKLEEVFEAQLRIEVAVPAPPTGQNVDVALRDIAVADDGPSVSRFLQRSGTFDQFCEFVIHRSIYQLKEADPHSWAIPRLRGKAKAALVEIQSDEYGGGRPERIHAELFANTMTALGLDGRYGAYIDYAPATTLATVNLMSMFGLHRRLRGAIVGHLAMFEMTSSVPNRRYADGLRRLGAATSDAVEFFDEHVEADAVHESLAAVDLAGGLLEEEPHLGHDVLFGACALLHVETLWAADLLSAWEAQATSLRVSGCAPVPALGPTP
jgi:hypothetical protein